MNISLILTEESSSSQHELPRLFLIVENEICLAHRGQSERMLVDSDGQPCVSVGPGPCPASLRAEAITISAHLKRIPCTPALICIVLARGASILFRDVPGKRDSSALAGGSVSLWPAPQTQLLE